MWSIINTVINGAGKGLGGAANKGSGAGRRPSSDKKPSSGSNRSSGNSVSSKYEKYYGDPDSAYRYTTPTIDWRKYLGNANSAR